MIRSDQLAGLSVLILEDDYLLADDTRRALEAAGAQVLGPCRTAAQAFAMADQNRPDCAIVDVNLGDGPSFAPARDFLARGVSIVFITGYDGSVIPPELSAHPCLQKPAQAHRIVAAVGKACPG